MIKYFCVNAKAPVYYAGYSLEAVKQQAASDFNSQFPIDAQEVNLDIAMQVIQAGGFIHSALLSFEDARNLAKLHDVEVINE